MRLIMPFQLINTERQPQQHQDTLCREILKVRDYHGLFKSCDVCGADIADDLPEFTLVAEASNVGPGSASKCTVVFELRTRYSYITCERCGDVRLPQPPEPSGTSSADNKQRAADGDADSATPTSPAAAAAGCTQAAPAAKKQPPAEAIAAAAAGKVRAGESCAPVHLQALYRLTIKPHTDGQVDSLTKTYVLHCPDCGFVSPELPNDKHRYDPQSVYGQACKHCSEAGHTTGDILGYAIASGAYDKQEQPVVWPGQPLSPIDDAVQQTMVRVAAATATFITLSTRAAAKVELHPKYWRAKQVATHTAPCSSPHQSACAGSSIQQVELPLALRGWAVALLSGNDDVLYDANWARPSLQRLDMSADPDRPPASLLDLISAPPFVGVGTTYHAGGGLSKLAALILRKRKALEQTRQGNTPQQQRKRRQQQQQQSEAAASQHTPAAAATGPEVSCGTAFAAGAAAAGSSAVAAGSGTGTCLSIAEVLGLMLSEDPAFEDLPAEQRVPTFLQLSQVGSLADIEAATVNSAMVFNKHMVHMANCGCCGRSQNALVQAKLACAFQRCSYCCAAVCIHCCQNMVEMAADVDEDERVSHIAQPTAAAAAAAAAAGGKMSSAAAPRKPAAAARRKSAAADASPVSNWPQGLCPWCADHPDTQHLRQSSCSSPDAHNSQQQQQRGQRNKSRQATATSVGSKRPRQEPPASLSDDVIILDDSGAAAAAAGGGGGDSSMQDISTQQHSRHPAPGICSPTAAAAAAAAAGAAVTASPHAAACAAAAGAVKIEASAAAVAAAAAAGDPATGKHKRQRVSGLDRQPAHQTANAGAQEHGRQVGPDQAAEAAAAAAQQHARQPVKQEEQQQQQDSQQQQQQHFGLSQLQNATRCPVKRPVLGTQLPDFTSLSSSDNRYRFVLALLPLLPELSATLGPQQLQQLQQQQLLQLQAISRALLGQDDMQEAWCDTLLIYYGFLSDSVAAGNAEEAQHDLKNLLAEGSDRLDGVAEQQLGGGVGGSAQQQQQGGGGWLAGFELQCIGDLDSPPSKVALNLSIELRRLFDKLGGGAGQSPEPPAQQQPQQQYGAAVQPLFALREAKSKLKQVCKALLASMHAADGGGDIRAQVLVQFGFLQAWVALGDVGQVQQALAALLSAAGPGSC